MGSRKGKPGTTNLKQSSGLVAMVGDQGTKGDDVRGTTCGGRGGTEDEGFQDLGNSKCYRDC